MEWYEYLIIVAAVCLVALPIVLAVRNKKKGKPNCSCGCEGCQGCSQCLPRKKEENKK